MHARLDHVVLWVDDPLRSLVFYESVIGLAPVRAEEFRAGAVPFPSARVSDDTILDFMSRVAAGEGGGHPVNHVCLALPAADWEALRGRLDAHGVAVSGMMERSFGARGLATRALYFSDPDGNVIEARYYPE